MGIGETIAAAASRARFGEPESEPDGMPLTWGDIVIGGFLFVMVVAIAAVSFFGIAAVDPIAILDQVPAP